MLGLISSASAVRAARGGAPDSVAGPRARVPSRVRNSAAPARGAGRATLSSRRRASSAWTRARGRDDDFADAMFDDDDEYPGMSSSRAPRWAIADDEVSMTPDQRRAAASGGDRAQSWSSGGEPADRGFDDVGRSDRWPDAFDDRREPFSRDDPDDRAAPRARSWANDDDIIAGGGQDWFEGEDDWYEPEYNEVNAPEGSILEKVQRLHLRQPRDFTFEDGEYFDLTGYVKDNTDNQFALVLEVAERARERRMEHLEALNPAPSGMTLPPIQQAIVDLALEVEASGGKTSAFSAMREAGARARLRFELQEAAWAWDHYCEEKMEALGVSERAARLLHMGQRVEDAMDFEKDLSMHEEEYNAKPPRSGLG